MFRVLLLTFILFSPATLLAENTNVISSETIATIEKIDGSARLLREGELRKRKVSLGDNLIAGDILSTSPSGKIRLKLYDDSSVTIGNKSTIKILTRYQIEQSAGKAFYQIKKRIDQHKLSIITDFVLIGVKGTTFLVSNTDEQQAVSLQEGDLNMQSLAEEFELYRLAADAGWKNFQKQSDDSFSQFKQSQQPGSQEAEFVKSFQLAAGRSVSFDNNKTVEELFNDNLIEEMKEFEMF